MNSKLLGTFITLLVIRAGAQVGSTDPGFNTGAGVAGSYVHAVALAADGRIIIGGNFSRVQGEVRNFVARLNCDGTLDQTFVTSNSANAEILGLASLPDQKIVIVGVFTRVSNLSRGHVARLNADGSVDSTFDPGTGANGEVRCVAVQPDGKLLVGGPFTKLNGVLCNGLARLNPDGTVDPGFSTGTGFGGERFVDEVLVLPDGKIIAAGDFPTYNGIKRASIVRLNSDGSLDPTFDPGPGAKPGDPILGVAFQADGKILLAGSFIGFGGKSWNNIARITCDGAPDPVFDPGNSTSGGPINGALLSIEQEADGKILIGGWFDAVNGVARPYLARLLPDGRPDTNWNVRVDGPVRVIKLQTDRKVLLGGSFARVNGAAATRVIRLNASGPLPARLSSCRPTATGELLFELRADPVRCYTIERSEDLVHWSPWLTSACTNGSIQFTDPDAGVHTSRFYRAVLVQ